MRVYTYIFAYVESKTLTTILLFVRFLKLLDCFQQKIALFMRNTGSLVYLYRTRDSICICSISATPLYPPETKTNLVGGFNPLQKIWVKLGSSCPSFRDETSKNLWVATPWNCRHLQVFKSGFSHEKLCKLDLLRSGPSCPTDPPMDVPEVRTKLRSLLLVWPRIHPSIFLQSNKPL